MLYSFSHWASVLETVTHVLCSISLGVQRSMENGMRVNKFLWFHEPVSNHTLWHMWNQVAKISKSNTNGKVYSKTTLYTAKHYMIINKTNEEEVKSYFRNSVSTLKILKSHIYIYANIRVPFLIMSCLSHSSFSHAIYLFTLLLPCQFRTILD